MIILQPFGIHVMKCDETSLWLFIAGVELGVGVMPFLEFIAGSLSGELQESCAANCMLTKQRNPCSVSFLPPLQAPWGLQLDTHWTL